MTSVAIDRAAGLASSTAVKGPCRAVSLSNVTLSGEQTVGGVSLVEGDRVLLAGQTDAVENGIYVVSANAWARAKDFSRNGEVRQGTLVVVGGTVYSVTTADPIVIGTDEISFTTAVDGFTNLLGYGAIPGASAGDNTAKFNAAIAASNLIYIPPGAWRWTGTLTAPDVVWLIDKDATFPDVDTVGPLNIPDLATLGGRIQWMAGTYGTGWRMGSGSAWLEDFRNYSITLGEFVVVSPTGGYGLIGASRSSDNLPANFNTIGIGGFAYNDNETNPEPSWGGYFEVGREPLAGAALGIEIDCWNADTVSTPLTPYSVRTESSTDTINLWLSAGGGTGSPGNGYNSAAIGVNPNGQRFDRGILFRNSSIDTTINEAMALYKGLKIAWYDTSNIAQTYITGDGSQFVTKSDTALSGHEDQFIRKRADGTTATGASDEVHVDRGAGWDGSAVYYGTYIQYIQRSAFAGGEARFSVDIGAKNTSGVYREVSLNGLANDTFSPNTDNVLNLGTGSFRWKEIFAGNATINTSDANLKTDIRSATDVERQVARTCKELFKAYRWKDAVAEKGAEARIHFGVIAQEVAAAFEAESLDPFAYGIVCRDEVEEARDVIVHVPMQKTVKGLSSVEAIEIIDGRAVSVTREVEIDVPQVEEMPVWYGDGTPVMEPIYKSTVFEKVVDGKVHREVVRVKTGERQAIHTVPVMVDVERVTREIVKTGEYRMGVRYSELFAFILAGT